MKTMLLTKHELPKIVTILAVILSVSALAQPQQAWVARYNGGFTNQTHTPLAIALDHSGNVYVAGSSQNASNLYDYLVLKYAPGGTQLFAARYSSTNGANYTVNGFALDQNDNTYETGTGGTVKIANNGALAWTAPYSGNDIAVDTNGNEYVTGFSTSTYATVKLDSNGSNLWLRSYLSRYGYTPAISHEVTVDNMGNVYVAGYETWSVYGYYQAAILKYDGSGNPAWTNEGGGAFNWNNTGLIVDNQGNLYDSGNDASYAWVSKLNTTSGQGVWGQQVGNPPPPLPRDGLVLDTNGNVYIVGGAYICAKLASTNGQVVWGVYQGAGANSIALDNISNVYVAGSSSNGTNYDSATTVATTKYDNNGNQLWVIRYHGPANGNDGANAIAVAPDGSIYVTGYSANTSGGTDIVTIKYSPVTLQRRSDGTVWLQAQGTNGESFDFQGSTDLMNWLDLGSVLADSNGLAQFQDTNASNYNWRFYVTSPQ